MVVVMVVVKLFQGLNGRLATSTKGRFVLFHASKEAFIRTLTRFGKILGAAVLEILLAGTLHVCAAGTPPYGQLYLLRWDFEAPRNLQWPLE